MTKRVAVITRTGKSLGVLEFSSLISTVGELKSALAPKIGIPAHRMRLTTEAGVGLEGPETALSKFPEFSKNPNVTLVGKDLGPQVSWRTVFLVEYLGPILVVLGEIIFLGRANNLTNFQVTCIACYLGHFVKRELETVFVHKFSNDSMPIANLFKNSFYYWGSAAAIGYYLSHPLYTAPSGLMRKFGLLIFLASEFLNFFTHAALSKLRPAGTRVRRVPRGIFFDQITCPNYTFEVLAWIGFAMMTQVLAAWVFALATIFILSNWALAKRRRYVKEFDGLEGRDKFPKRWAIFPGIL